MVKQRDLDRLRHMLEAAQKLVDYSHGKSLSEIQGDELLSLALLRLLEVFGEAARCMSEPLQKRHPEVPWVEIIGTRAWVAHGYMDIDMRIVYSVLLNDLPPLITRLPAIIKDES